MDYDVRKTFPYSSYDEFDFKIRVQHRGGLLRTIQVRMAEMRESLKIVRQAMEKIPAEGPIKRGSAGNRAAATRRR